MKTKIKYLVLLCVGLSLGWSLKQNIRWYVEGTKTPFVEISNYKNGSKIELGLASDGCVVWREIKPSVASETNSPAESSIEYDFKVQGSYTWPNSWTNLIYNGDNVIKLGN